MMLTELASMAFFGLIAFFALRTLAALVCSVLHARGERTMRLLPHTSPSVSIILPCYNEEAVLENCVTSLLTQRYRAYEIIIVNDGSSDATAAIAAQLAATHPQKIRAVSKANGGKASALNAGIRQARGEVIVTIDADSVFLPATLSELVRGFTGPEVGAVCGNVKVANRTCILGRHQAAEYILSLNLDRRLFAWLGCIQIIPGAIGAFRKEALLAVGGYATDTVVEDMDLTVTLVRHGYKVHYLSHAIAYTEAPETLRGFLQQRHRWLLGGFQVLAKHHDMLFNPRYGSMGLIGLPSFVIAPLFALAGTLSLLMLFSTVVLTLALPGSILSLLLWIVLIPSALLLWGLYLDREDPRLLATSVTNALWYPHLITIAYARAFIAFAGNRPHSWDKLPRLGKNIAAT